ncbi:AFG2-interacting ribosome maturation factor-like [Apostichopus japonicus]|uniref:AFG2-interacting ribosome maturation factor-like n=1 Tax=Stichopus japonicus TaxID=307972 RepID=UPI003AB465DE
MEPLKQHIKKVFATLRGDLKTRRECLTSTEALWESLINTVEQYHCCSRAQEGKTNVAVFRDFPEANEKLQTKLVSTMSLLVDRIQKKMPVLEKTSKAAHTGWQSTWQLLAKQGRHVDVAESVKGTSTEPCLADMLLWLQRLNLLLQQDYAERAWMLESMDFESETLMVGYHSLWLSKQKILQQEIDTIFAYLQFSVG